MKIEQRKPRELLDCRMGGSHNWLIVESPEGHREAWLVDYDRWRDEGWTVERAWPLYQVGKWAAACIVFVLDEYAMVTLSACFAAPDAGPKARRALERILRLVLTDDQRG